MKMTIWLSWEDLLFEDIDPENFLFPPQEIIPPPGQEQSH